MRISISLTREMLAALDKLSGNKGRSGYIAELIAEKASQSNVAIEEPKVITTADIVKKAAEGFEKSNGRPPTLTELQQTTALSYHQVWNAVRSLSIKTLDKSAYQELKRNEAKKQKRKQLEREAIPMLLRWFRDPSQGGLTHRKNGKSTIIIGKLEIELRRLYDDIRDALPELKLEVREILFEHGAITPSEYFVQRRRLTTKRRVKR